MPDPLQPKPYGADLMGVSTPATKRKKRKRRKPSCAPVKKHHKKKSAHHSAIAAAHKKRKRKPHRCTAKKRKKKPVLRPGGTNPATTLPAAGTNPGTVPPPANPPKPPRLHTIASPIAVYDGAFGPRQAERLLWRAGFGPRPGDVERLAALDLEGAVLSLTRPSGAAQLTGPEPTIDGAPLSALDTWYGDHIYWMDRMLRSEHQLVERLALVFHDWWATSNSSVGSNQMMLEQTNVFRANGLGSFRDMAHAVTADPAMLIFLNGIDNDKDYPNENYAREVMELFTLGADRGAYTEDDVRELARCLTGWRADWSEAQGLHNFRFDARRWDPNYKTVFGQSGKFNWEDAVRLVVDHPLHASFFVAKLWSYFVPEAPSADVAARLEQLYRDSGNQIRPVVEAILCSPEFHEGPRMTKPPVVYVTGMLRAVGQFITGEQWAWLCDGAGQRLYYPPDVSGWDDKRWLDSNTIRGRWDCVNYAVEGRTLRPDSDEADAYPAETPEQAVASARAFWLDPSLTAETVDSLLELARAFQPADDTEQTPAWQKRQRAQMRTQRQTMLRHLIAVSPDYQTC
jgi:uncharacterized protein (DUF1800 family)